MCACMQAHVYDMYYVNIIMTKFYSFQAWHYLDRHAWNDYSTAVWYYILYRHTVLKRKVRSIKFELSFSKLAKITLYF